MLLAVTIPQKQIIVDFNIDQVKTAISRLPEMFDNCKFVEKNEILKKYDLQFTSFMSLGNKLSITLEEVSENKTKIVTDITRMVGTFNQSTEVTNANEDYTKMIASLSKLLANPQLSETEIKTEKTKNSNKGLNIILYIITAGVLLYLFAA